MDIKVNKNTVVVFDLDDTLYYELDYLISAYKYISNYLDKENSKKLFSILISLYRNNENVFEYLESNYEINKIDLLNIYQHHIPTIKPNKGVKKILKSIKKNKGRIAIITDGRSVSQKNKIKALGLEPYIDFIAISEEVGAEKPSVKAFNLVMTNLPAKEYFYIADNFKKDFIAPNKLNWLTIGIIDDGKNIHSNAYLYQTKEQLPEYLAYSINELTIK